MSRTRARSSLRRRSSASTIFCPPRERSRHACFLAEAWEWAVPGEQEEGRIEWIEIGPYTLKLPLAAYARAKAGAFARTDIAGILGGELWRRFAVTLDCPHGRMILEPGRQFGDPFDFDASGMTVRSPGPPHRQLVVTRVIDGTPSAEAGIRKDDRILEFDGVPAASLTVWRVRTTLKKADADHVLKLQRGAAEIGVKLRTRKLI